MLPKDPISEEYYGKFTTSSMDEPNDFSDIDLEHLISACEPQYKQSENAYNSFNINDHQGSQYNMKNRNYTSSAGSLQDPWLVTQDLSNDRPPKLSDSPTVIPLIPSGDILAQSRTAAPLQQHSSTQQTDPLIRLYHACSDALAHLHSYKGQYQALLPFVATLYQQFQDALDIPKVSHDNNRLQDQSYVQYPQRPLHYEEAAETPQCTTTENRTGYVVIYCGLSKPSTSLEQQYLCDLPECGYGFPSVKERNQHMAAIHRL